MEHVVELNTIRDSFRDALNGVLPSRSDPRNLPLDNDYLQALSTPMLLNAPPMAGGQASSTPLVRIMNALGSNRNDQDFLVLISALNGLKSRVRYPRIRLLSAPQMTDAFYRCGVMSRSTMTMTWRIG